MTIAADREDLTTRAAGRPQHLTLIDVFRAGVVQRGAQPALRRRAGDEWEAIPWTRYGSMVDTTAAGLITLGFDNGDRGAILSTNRPEWHVADLAIMSTGGVTVPLYATSSSSQIAYVLRHAGVSVCFVEDRDQLSKILLRRHELPDLRAVVVLSPVGDGLDDPFVIGYDDLVERGEDLLAREPGSVIARAATIEGDDLATIVYTSGTTGPPKGALLTHDNLMWTIRSVTRVVPIGPGDRFLSFLPLSHIAERIVSHLGQIVSGGETWFARSLATVPEDLKACRPTIFFAVPRVWEKLHDALVERFADLPGPARSAMDRFVASGSAMVRAGMAGTRPRVSDRVLHRVLDATLGERLRAEMGLGDARVLVSGAAPIHPDLLVFFHALGLPIAEVYGQTEDCGPTTLNPPGRIRIGTVGLPLPGVQVRVAADGEILVKGGNVFRGYYEDPQRTAETFDGEGWMRSGDIGTLDRDGYLTISGRKKDLIITSSGKNIAPQVIESRLEIEPLISKVVVVGEARPYLTALVTLDTDAAGRWAVEHGKLASLEALSTDPDLIATIDDSVERTNAERSRIEAIKRFRVLPVELTVASGALTPTLKVKRDVVMARYGDLVEEMYAG